MGNFVVWKIDNQKPVRVEEGAVDLERHLEEWLESDPSMLPGSIEVIARQMHLEGGRLDLLAIDPLGRWIVIEIKAGQVDQSTFTQALYYSAQIDAMPYQLLEQKVNSYLESSGKSLSAVLTDSGISIEDQRENRKIILYLVGTKKSLGMENLMDFVNNHSEIDTSIIIFEVFDMDSTQQVLVREVMDREEIPFQDNHVVSENRSVDQLLELADRNGIGQNVRKLHQFSLSRGLYPRPYKQSIMYTSPRNRTRMIYTVNIKDNPTRLYIGYEGFEEFYGLKSDLLAKTLGATGWRKLTDSEMDEMISRLSSLPFDETA